MKLVDLGAHCLLALLWLVHWLPLGLQAAIGSAAGRVMHALAQSRRHIARRNVELCLPHMAEGQRHALVREHFRWLGRSLLERPLLWYASAERLRRLIHVEGEVQLAKTSERPVMWLVPHFVGLDVAGVAALLFQNHRGASIYQRQSNAVLSITSLPLTMPLNSIASSGLKR